MTSGTGALGSSSAGRRALDALRGWLELADKDGTAIGPVSRVIDGIARLAASTPIAGSTTWSDGRTTPGRRCALLSAS